MAIEIEAYSLACHQQSGCIVRIKGKGIANWYKIQVSAEQLSAMAAILKQSPVFYDNGWIYTGAEPTLE